MTLPPEVVVEVETVLGNLDGRDLVVMAIASGGAWVCAVNEQEWYDLINKHEMLGSRAPAAARYRRAAEGGWVREAGWDIRRESGC